MLKENAHISTPLPESSWCTLGFSERINLVEQIISAEEKFSCLALVSADVDGSVIVRSEKLLAASERGGLLLDLEEVLKIRIDPGLVVWFEATADKNKLRNLRGVIVSDLEEKKSGR